MTELSLTEARKQFGALIRRAASARERVTITDHGQPAAVIVGAQELADLEEALAVAGTARRRRRARCRWSVTPRFESASAFRGGDLRDHVGIAGAR